MDLTDVTLVPVRISRRRTSSSQQKIKSPTRCRVTDTEKLMSAKTLQQQASILIDIYTNTTDDYRLELPNDAVFLNMLNFRTKL